MSSSPAMPSVLGEAVAGSPGVARESLAFEAAEGQVDWGGQDERLAGGWGWGGRTWPKSAERLWGGQVSAPLNGRFHARKNEGRRREHGPQQVRWTRPSPASHRGRAWGRGQLPGPRPREWLPGEAGRVPQGRWKAGVQQRL